ncbi:MAG: DUF3179 domain-containing protein, partial [Pseudomonadota bacterium]
MPVRSLAHPFLISVFTLGLASFVPFGDKVWASPETDRTVVASPIEDDYLIDLLNGATERQVDRAIREIRANWTPALIPQLLEIVSNTRSGYSQTKILDLLSKRTGKRYGPNINRWYDYLWSQDEQITDNYASFKAFLYSAIDPRFAAYFDGRQESALIRLDEIRWGGVQQDGIPPLRQPEMITAEQATYLNDSDIVFALEINGDARAYPKRILAWHEMFVDQIGGVDIVGVYCTLCGVVIPYESKIDDVVLDFGTSGFLYRSNKLMYDRQTSSLWNTFTGEPVVGPLAGNGFKPTYHPVVTTRWGDWKRLHPDTQVLSLETGHRRDYGEGIAYKDYFSTDELMFTTPFDDERLDNKQEVLALRFPGAPNNQLAIDTDYLNANPIVTETIGLQDFVILTDQSGANRVYERGDHDFIDYDRGQKLVDQAGTVWTVAEDRLVSETGETLARLPAHRAFWFGWYAA